MKCWTVYYRMMSGQLDTIRIAAFSKSEAEAVFYRIFCKSKPFLLDCIAE